MLANSVDEVVERLDDIIEQTRQEKSRLGYFPALYRNVTTAARQGLDDSTFENPERMARLIVVFANRYLEAYDRHRAGQENTRSWQIAFAATEDWWPIVLQHLLLGINAHINLDLGIATARTNPGQQLQIIKRDFNRINDLLADMIEGVSRKLAEIWPLLRLLDWIAGRSDEAIINFSITKARDAAWRVAETLAPLEETAQQPEIDRLDRHVARLGQRIRHPGPVISSVLRVVRLGERGTIPEIIDILGRTSAEVKKTI